MARKSHLSLWIALFFCPFVAWAAANEPPTLSVHIRDGRVALEASGTGLNEQQLRALGEGVAREMTHTPFQRGGSVDLVLRGDRLVELTEKIKSADIVNPGEVDQIVSQTWSTADMESDAARSPASLTEGKSDESSKVMIGQNFDVAANESLEALVVIGGTGRVEGKVKTLVAIGSTVDLGPQARVDEDLVSLGSVVRKSPGSSIIGQEVTVSLPSWSALHLSDRWSEEAAPITVGTILIAFVVGYFVSLALGSLYLRFFPGFQRRVEIHLRAHRGSSFGYGLLAQILAIPGGVVLVVSVVGLLLMPFYLAVYGVLMFIGYITIAHLIGSAILKNRGIRALAPLALGLFLLDLLRLVPVIGWILATLLAIAGFGAVMVTAWHMFQNRRTPPPVQPGPTANTWTPAHGV